MIQKKSLSLLGIMFLLASVACGPAPSQQDSTGQVPEAPQPSASAQAPTAGSVALPQGDYTHEAGMSFKTVPGGSFLMGSPDGKGAPNEYPQQNVKLSEFQIQLTELTQGQWQAVMGEANWPAEAPSELYGLGENYPVYHVNWCDVVGASGDPLLCADYADSFLDRLNAQGTGTYRLPTEAEWEYAARAGSTSDFACGNFQAYQGNENKCPYTMGWSHDNFSEGGFRGAHPVAQKNANAFGIYDMHGNVSEWVQDWYVVYGEPQPELGAGRVTRGGSWSSPTDSMRSAYRSAEASTQRFHARGFRLVRIPN